MNDPKTPDSKPIRLRPMHEVDALMTEHVETNGYVGRSGKEREIPNDPPAVPEHPDDEDLIGDEAG